MKKRSLGFFTGTCAGREHVLPGGYRVGGREPGDDKGEQRLQKVSIGHIRKEKKQEER